MPDMRIKYATNNRNFQLAKTAQPSKRGGSESNHVISKEIKDLDHIACKEKMMLAQIS